MAYTNKQKKEYYKKLRADWTMTKLKADEDKVCRKMFDELGLEVSYYGFYYAYQQMQDLGLTGLPYIDCKTFKGWLDSGWKVIKGEKSKIKGITWIGVDEDEDEEPEYLYPKIYHLFHKSQVEKR